VIQTYGGNLNPYVTLGVAREATPAQIKAAYRKLAKKHHPDAGGNGETFAQIAAAFAVLEDPERRHRYDTTGATDTPQDIERQQALGLLSELLANAIQGPHEPFETDLVRAMKEAIAEMAAGIGQEVAKLAIARDRIAKMRGRFTIVRVSDEPNIFDSILTTHAALVERRLDEMNKRRAVATRATELLADYRFAADIVQSVWTTTHHFFSTSSTVP